MEVLVVIGLLGLLAALALAGLSAGRRSAYRVACAEKLRTLGVALHLYTDIHKVTPPLFWTQGHGSVWAFCLPFLDGAPQGEPLTQMEQYQDKRFLALNVKWGRQFDGFFRCPAGVFATSSGESAEVVDGVPGFHFQAGPCSYAVNLGSAVEALNHPLRGPFENYGVRLSAITAGLGKTAFVSEVLASKPVPPNGATLGPGYLVGIEAGPKVGDLAEACLDLPPANARTSPVPIGLSWWDNLPHNFKYSHGTPPGAISCEHYMLPGRDYTTHATLISAGSEHEGVVNVLMGNGSLQSIPNSIDRAIWAAMGNRDGRPDLE